jgi:hypothetical protein
MPDGSPTIWNSRATFDKVFAALQVAFSSAGEGEAEFCTIAIRDPQPAIPVADLPPRTGPEANRNRV